MHGSARACVSFGLVALLLALALPVPAGADGGCGAPGRPACTVLRPLAATAPSPVGLGAPDCVVQIGGLGSTAGSTARAFEGLRIDGAAVSVLDYDAVGKVAAAAEALRHHVARISPSCDAIHLVAHSMGGVVADRAFSKGLSGAEGIATYLPLASPHNGSSLARELCGVGDGDPEYAALLRHLSSLLDLPDPTADGICDLAQVQPPRPPRGVSTARLRLVTDPLVLRRDHAAPYRDVRELLPLEPAEAEGHSGILASAQAREIVRSSIAERSVAADGRGAAYRLAADSASRGAEGVLSPAHQAVGDLVWSGAAVARLAAFARGLLQQVRESVVLAGPHVLSYLSHLPTVGSERLSR
ncbi:MAG: esterase/lipase family protein [Candidatus Limnocylindria bacterium]